MKRLFLVGCPRSGTTLLQSLMASHSRIISFPETHLFSSTISINPLIQLITIYGRKDLVKVEEILKALGVPTDIVQEVQIPRLSTSSWIKSLMPVLNHIATSFDEEHQSDYLLEKTPRHLHFADQIQQADPEAQFIHIIRRGEDVVASLHEATRNSPDQWSGSRSLQKSIFWWNRSVRISERYLGKKNHHFVWYDELVDQTETVLNNLFSSLNIPYEEVMLSRYQATAESLILEEESWKSKNTAGEITASQKFMKLPETDRQMIRKKLYKFDFSKITVSKENN